MNEYTPKIGLYDWTKKPRPKVGKKSKREKCGEVDLKYIRFVKQLPCAVCYHHSGSMATPSDAHHTICNRFSQGKTPDWQAIPLCKEHHQFSPAAIHESKEAWVELYGLDTDYIAWTLDEVKCKFGYEPVR